MLKKTLPLILLIALTLSGCTKNEIAEGRSSQSEPLRNEDFVGKRVAVQTGTVFEDFFREHVGDAKFLYVNSPLECVEAVKSGRADVTIDDEPILRNYAAKNPGLVIIEPPISIDEYGVIVNKDKPELLAKLNEFYQMIVADGTYDDMLARWVDSPVAPPMPDIPEGRGELLRAGVTLLIEPFGYYGAGMEPLGFDVEYLRRFAAWVDMSIEFTDYNFASRIDAVASGRADLCAGLITITEERAKMVNFTEPYYIGGTSLITYNPSAVNALRTFNPDDFTGKTFAVITGSIHDAILEENIPGAVPVYFNSAPETIMALMQGKVDATFEGTALAGKFSAIYPDLELLYPPIMEDHTAFIFGKDKSDLRESFNGFLQESRENDVYADMEERWMKTVESPPMPKIESSAKNGKLIFATTGSNDVFSFVQNGNPTGFEVELAYRFAAYMEMELEIQLMDFAALLPAVQSGKADFSGASFGITEERKLSVDFSDPVYSDGIIVAVRKESRSVTPQAFRPDDFTGKTFAILTGTPWDTILEEHIPGAKQAHFNSVPETIMSLKQGKVDATFTSTALAKKFGVMYPELTLLYPPVTESEVALVFGKEHSALREDFNAFLREIRENGVYEDMTERWLDTPEPPEMPEIENSGANGKLVFATTGNSDVYSFIQNGKPTGFEVETAYRFAAYMDMELDIQLMDFPALIPAIQSGKAQFAGARFAVTEERKQSVDFSDTILEDGIVVAVRKETAPASPSFFESLKTGFERNLIQEDRWKMIVDGLQVSLIITIFAFALATLLGFGVCGLRMSKNKLLNAIGSLYVTVLRGTPIVVLLMITFYVIFAKSSISGTTVAIIAFGANGAAFIGEIIRSAILTIDKGQVEAARSMGFSKGGAFFTVTFPQAVRVAFPTYMSEFVSTFKMTAVVGYIAIVDLTKAGDIIRSRTYDAFFPLLMVALVYLLAASLMIWLFNFINRKTNKRLRRVKAIDN